MRAGQIHATDASDSARHDVRHSDENWRDKGGCFDENHDSAKVLRTVNKLWH